MGYFLRREAQQAVSSDSTYLNFTNFACRSFLVHGITLHNSDYSNDALPSSPSMNDIHHFGLLIFTFAALQYLCYRYLIGDRSELSKIFSGSGTFYPQSHTSLTDVPQMYNEAIDEIHAHLIQRTPKKGVLYLVELNPEEGPNGELYEA